MARRSAEFEIKIDKLVYGGSGLGRHEGKVVFVPLTAPGDRVRVRLAEQKKNFARASVVELLEPGPGRQDPPCPHFGVCGGCQWQHLEYAQQLEFKRRILAETLHHHLPETRTLEIRMTASPQPFGYRTRARIQTEGGGPGARVGFFRLHSHRIEDVKSCPLFHPALNRALEQLRALRSTGELGGEVRQMDLACDPDKGLWAIAPAAGDQASAGGAESQSGEVPLARRVGAFTYHISPSTFFQANHLLLGPMVEKVCELARGAGLAAALDLFSGAGLFALPLALQFGRVVAVEASTAASRLCERNVREAGLTNVQCICAAVTGWMKAVGSVAAPAFDLVVLDPPRAGAGNDVMRHLVEWSPETIVYVSCDPQTLARDLSCLAPRYYRIDAIEGFDLFPQTFHIETVVRLRRIRPHNQT
jgi:23S rRNA (uracil1939-C5)-methyltransferase